jgi:ABC-type lipoprotein release transport system permease subunit
MHVEVDLARLAIPAPVAYRLTWLLALPFPVRNMLRRWRSMVGMMIGVGIALAIAMTLSAVGKATIDVLVGDFLRSGADLYVLQQGGTPLPVYPSDTPGMIRNARSTLAAIRGISGVKGVVGIVAWPLERGQQGPERKGERAELIAAVGIAGDPIAIPDMVVVKQGRWLRRPGEVVVGDKLHRDKKIAVGDIIRLNGRDFVVVGVGRLRGIGFDADQRAYLDYDDLRQRAGLWDILNTIMVDTDQPEVVRRRIEELGSFSTFDRAQLVKLAEPLLAGRIAIFNVLNFLALLIAGIFVSNVLGRSVAERRLEFATLRAIGIPSRTILLTVGAEALLISIVAGIGGVVLSLFFGALLNGYMAPEYGLESLYSADAGLFLTVAALALGLGVVAGYFPARAATRVDPVEVLREA